MKIKQIIIVLIIILSQNLFSQGLESLLFQIPQKPECIQYPLPVVQTRYFLKSEGDKKFKYKNIEYALDLESSAEVRTTEKPNLYLTILNDRDGNLMMIQMDSLDQFQRVIKSSKDFTTLKIINEISEISYLPNGKIGSIIRRKCPTCEITDKFSIQGIDQNSNNLISYKNFLGEFEIKVNKLNNKTEYIQYVKLSEEMIAAFKMAGKDLPSEPEINSKIYKIEMAEYDSIIVYTKPYGAKELQMKKIEILTKNCKAQEYLEFNENHTPSKHFNIFYNDANQIIEIKDNISGNSYKSTFNQNKQLLLEYTFDDTIHKIEHEYNSNGVVDKIYEFEELSEEPSSVVFFEYK